MNAGPPRFPVPPRLLEALLERLLPVALREPYLGDLREEYTEVCERRGLRRARFWYVSQILRSRPWSLRASRRGVESTRLVGAQPVAIMMNGVSHDIRDALRAVGRTPAASAIIVGTITVAVAAGTLVFSIYEGVVLRPFPYPEAESLVNVYMTNTRMMALDDPVSRRNGERFPLSYVALDAWRSSDALPLTVLGGYRNGSPLSMDGDGEVVPLQVSTVTAGVFEALGVSARHGRVLTHEDDRVGGPRVVVLTDAAWRGRFGGDAAILGRALRFGGDTYEVIGIMPPGFYFPARDVEAYIPFTDGQRQANSNVFIVQGIGRLRPGMDVEGARRTLNSIAGQVGSTIATSAAGANVISRRELILGDVDRALAVLMGTVLIVLLVAAVNVTSLLLARAEGRAGDLAIRTALGAGSGRIIRLTLVDTLVLVVTGGVIGVAFAWLALPAALALLPEALPRQDNIAFNGAVAAFALSAIAGTALLATLLPAVGALRIPPRELLGRAAGRGSAGGIAAQRTRSVLVMAEVAGAVVLLVGASLLTLSYARLTSVDLGFDPSNAAAVYLMLPPELSEQTDAAAAWNAAMLDELRAVPGVDDAVVTGDVPFSGGTASASIEYERDGGDIVEIDASIGSVAPGHFALLGARVLAGREFDHDDHADPAHGVLVNEVMASQLWPGVSAIGRRIRSDGEWHTVMGIAGDVRTVGPADDPAPRVYFPRAPSDRFGYVLIRTSVPVTNLVERLESTIFESFPGIQPAGTNLLDQQLAEAVAHPRFRTTLLIALASVTALLAVIGIYGVVSYTVARRHREIGVRIALGARSGQVLRSVVGRGMALTAAGGVAGIIIAMPLSRYLTEFLFDVHPAEPAALMGVLMAVLAVAAAAAYFPARRAASINPAESLRAD
jgi:predicted permease